MQCGPLGKDCRLRDLYLCRPTQRVNIAQVNALVKAGCLPIAITVIYVFYEPHVPKNPAGNQSSLGCECEDTSVPGGPGNTFESDHGGGGGGGVLSMTVDTSLFSGLFSTVSSIVVPLQGCLDKEVAAPPEKSESSSASARLSSEYGLVKPRRYGHFAKSLQFGRHAVRRDEVPARSIASTDVTLPASARAP